MLRYGAPVQIAATTSANVARLTLSYNGVAMSVPLIAPGKFSGTLPFTLVGTPTPFGTVQLTLTATKSDGTTASIPVPVTMQQ